MVAMTAVGGSLAARISANTDIDGKTHSRFNTDGQHTVAFPVASGHSTFAEGGHMTSVRRHRGVPFRRTFNVLKKDGSTICRIDRNTQTPIAGLVAADRPNQIVHDAVKPAGRIFRPPRTARTKYCRNADVAGAG